MHLLTTPKDGLTCFLTFRDDPPPGPYFVPGCSGTPDLGIDYCAEVPENYLSFQDTLNPLEPTPPIGRCRGNCNSDDDCEGDLECFIRDGIENDIVAPVPGCCGDGRGNYCYGPEDNIPTTPPATPNPTANPTARPTTTSDDCENPPPNDECDDATTIALLPYQDSGTTVCSTADFESASCGAEPNANGVWYRYTPSATKTIAVTVSGGPNVRIYSSQGCDDFDCLAEFNPTSFFVGVAGTEYRFLVSGQVFSLGSEYSIEVNDYEPPENDDCDTGIDVTSLPYQSSGITVGALPDFDESSCGADADANGVWYNYQELMESKIVTASIDSGQNLLLRVYSGGKKCMVIYPS